MRDDFDYLTKESCQYFSPINDESETIFDMFVPARKWLKNFRGNFLSFKNLDSTKDVIDKTISEILPSFLDAIENVGDSQFYSKVKIDNNFFEVKPELVKLAEDLANEGVLGELTYGINFNDEPRVFSFGVKYGDFLKNNSDAGNPPGESASGSSLYDINEALVRCLGEAAERTCGAFYKNRDLVFSSRKKLSDGGSNTVNPRDFASFSTKQLANLEYLSRARVDDKSLFKWAMGKSLVTGKKIYVPAHLLYVPYKYEVGESFIRLSITTGAAIYTEKNEAIYRGICEIVERDAFMIFYLNKLSPPIIDLESSFDGELKTITKLFKRHNLECYVLDFTTDIPIPTFATVIIDRTGIGPAVNVGNRSDLNAKKAVIGSIEEALKSRPWIRANFAKEPELVEKMQNESGQKIKTLKERCAYWYPLKMIEQIEFWMKGPKEILNANAIPSSADDKLKKVLEYFHHSNSEVLVVETTIAPIKKLGLSAFMVLIPEAQPLYLWEEYKCLGGKRLYEVPVKLGYFDKPKKEEELNPVPHPFP